MKTRLKTEIRTYNNIAPEGLAVFDEQRYKVGPDLRSPAGILLRSHKLTTSEIDDSVLAIGRAGAGVNNIPLSVCTKRGIVVFNAPGANANAVAELALGVVLAIWRRLPAALKFLESLPDVEDDQELETLVEKHKKEYRGSELYGARLGVVGLGAIGSRLAHCAVELGVEVLGYDPAITVENAWRLPANVKRCNSLEELLAMADIVSLHIPAVADTINLIDAQKLAGMRPDALLLNYARGAVVDDEAVLQALEKGKLGFYACDFPTPALLARQHRVGDVMTTPHLGASTHQAESNSSVMAAQQLVRFLSTGEITNSVNYPDMSAEWITAYRLIIANINTSGILGLIMDELAQASINVSDMYNKSQGEVAWSLIDMDQKPPAGLEQTLAGLEGVVRVRVLASEQDE